MWPSVLPSDQGLGFLVTTAQNQDASPVGPGLLGAQQGDAFSLVLVANSSTSPLTAVQARPLQLRGRMLGRAASAAAEQRGAPSHGAWCTAESVLSLTLLSLLGLLPCAPGHCGSPPRCMAGAAGRQCRPGHGVASHPACLRACLDACPPCL